MFLVALSAPSAHASLSLAIHGERWADTRLPLLPKNLVTGNLTFDDSWLGGLVVNWVAVDGWKVPLPFTGKTLARWDVELEGQVIRHYGYQHHTESTAAVVLRTRDFLALGRLPVNFSMGNGLSWAHSKPAYEKGVTNTRGVETRQLQYHLSFETEFFRSAASRFSPFIRLHHRSGIWGVISPQHTGSNYLGIGVRYAIR